MKNRVIEIEAFKADQRAQRNRRLSAYRTLRQRIYDRMHRRVWTEEERAMATRIERK